MCGSEITHVPQSHVQGRAKYVLCSNACKEELKQELDIEESIGQTRSNREKATKG